MSFDAALKANPQLSKGGEPSVCALNDPSMASKPVVALNPFARDAWLDASSFEMVPATCEVISFVSVELVRPAQGSAPDTANRRQRIDQFFKHHRIVPIRPCHAEHQRDAVFVSDEVPLAAELASVRRVGARVRAPRGLATEAPSRLARLKSNWSAPRSSASNTICRRCHTPPACHCLSLRQQVMPLPYPSSNGKCSQGVPVRSTNKMPLSAFSSSSLGRPPLGDTGVGGSSGLSFFHSAALISLFFFMPCQTSVHLFALTGFVSGS